MVWSIGNQYSTEPATFSWLYKFGFLACLYRSGYVQELSGNIRGWLLRDTSARGASVWLDKLLPPERSQHKHIRAPFIFVSKKAFEGILRLISKLEA